VTTSPPLTKSSQPAGAGQALLPWLKDLRYRRIATAVASGGAARALSSLITLISLPLAVRYLGAERYGVWATVVSIAVWVNLLDLGIGHTLTNFISRAYAHADRQEAARALTNAVAVTTSAATLAGCGFIALWLRLDWTAIFNAGVTLDQQVRWTVLIAGLLVLLGLPLNLAAKVFAGYQELHTYNRSIALAAACSLAGLALGVGLRVSMPLLFLLSYGSITAVALGTMTWLVVRHKPWLRPKVTYLSRPTTLELLGSGWSFLLINAAAIVVFSSDNIIVSHFLGAAEVTPYSITWRVVGIGAVLQTLVFPALWPAYAEAQARQDAAWIRRTFAMAMRVTVALSLGWALLLIGFGRIAIRIWAGAAAVPPLSLLLAMAIWSVIAGFTTAQSCLLGALNRTRVQAVASALAAVVNIALSILLVTRLGSLGVILGTIISYIVVLMVPQTIVVIRVLRDLSRQQVHHGGTEDTADTAEIRIRTTNERVRSWKGLAPGE